MDDRIAALATLVAAGHWREADLETRRLLVDDVDVGGYVGIDADEAAEMDASLIGAIDRAWTGPTDGRFGLSPQLGVLAEVIDEAFDDNETWRQFGREVGWVVGRKWIDDDEIRYESDAPVGHLPYVPGALTVVNTGRIYEGFVLFYDRVGACLG